MTVITPTDSSSHDILEWSPTSDEFFVQLSDFTVNGNRGNSATGDGILVTDADGGAVNDMQMHNLFVINSGGIGINIATTSWGFRIINCISEFCDDSTLKLVGSQHYVTNCFLAYGNLSTGSYSVDMRADQVQFVGNTVYGRGNHAEPGQWGMRINSVINSQITGNNFRNFWTNKYAFIVKGVCTGTAIVGNTFTGNVHAVNINSAASGCMLSNNTFASNTTVDLLHTSSHTVSVFDNVGDKPIDEHKLETMTNTSGGALVAGDVVTLKAAAAGTEITTSTTAGDDLVFGMAAESIADTADGKILTRGKTTQLKVDGTTDIAIGDFLTPFTTAKIAAKAASGDMAFAVALEAYTADDSSGVIDALLITPRKI